MRLPVKRCRVANRVVGYPGVNFVSVTRQRLARCRREPVAFVDDGLDRLDDFGSGRQCPLVRLDKCKLRDAFPDREGAVRHAAEVRGTPLERGHKAPVPAEGQLDHFVDEARAALRERQCVASLQRPRKVVFRPRVPRAEQPSREESQLDVGRRISNVALPQVGEPSGRVVEDLTLTGVEQPLRSSPSEKALLRQVREPVRRPAGGSRKPVSSERKPAISTTSVLRGSGPS